jgi:hypothetical protein
MRLKWYGWLGLGVIIVAEVLMFLRVEPVATWFTPIVWTGYILFADALALHLRGESLIHDRLREFLMMPWLSLALWLIFEVYNLRLMNWYYIGVPRHPALRNLAYGWSFATILPAIFETADWLAGVVRFERWRIAPRRFSPFMWALSFVVGLAFVTVPPALPSRLSRFLFGFVWLGFIFLVEPINYQMGAPSLFRQWEEGRLGDTLRFLTAGAVCGLLWEFWNYWALAKWIYAVPFLSDIKIFEMPVVGFLGFPPFALECFVLYHLTRRLLRGDDLWKSKGPRP